MDIQKIAENSIAYIDEKLKTWRLELQEEINSAYERKRSELEKLKREFIELNAACEEFQAPWNQMDSCKFLFTKTKTMERHNCNATLELRLNSNDVFQFEHPYVTLDENKEYRFTILVTEIKQK